MRKIIKKGLASIYTDVPTLRAGTVEAYALAFVSAGVATVVRFAIDPYVEGAECLTFFPAVMITTLIGGLGAGIFCVVLSAAAAAFLLMPPLTLLLFVLLAIFSVILITRMRLAIQREQAAQAMQVSKDRLQLALDTAQLGWWRYDPRRRVIAGDKRFKEVFDVTSDEMPVDDIRKLVHPDDAERCWADGNATIALSDTMRSPPHEYRVQRRNGEVRWVEVRRLAYFEGNPRERRLASVVGTVHDITERKEREERERLLMSEINHRAKNMLSVVDAIAHQTTTKSPEDFRERLSARIQALAANQDLLIRNAWHGVEIEDLVHAQLAPFASLIGSRIAVHGPELRLTPASAQAIGLALHELATNAGRYGALSTDRGRVDVCWKSDGDSFTMSWTERDGPSVSAPKPRGFGTIVMEVMTERSVDGAVDLDYAPSGLTWRLTCPAATALEPWEREQNLGEEKIELTSRLASQGANNA
jgi:PAS domain S-box-containing protein